MGIYDLNDNFTIFWRSEINERMLTNLTFPAYFKAAQNKTFVESLSFQLLLFGRIQFFRE